MLEIIATTVEDALRIEAGGAGRIELVSALSEGGLTPSYGMIEEVVARVSIPVNVMIRPHAKSFYYTPADLAVMKRDIAAVARFKVNGVVFGVLNEAATTIEESALAELLAVCGNLEVTFHRAIDAIDPVAGIKILAKYPRITTILTSGGQGSPEKNVGVLKAMIANSGHIKILVGGGLTKENILTVMREVQAPQYHLGTAVRDNKSAFGEIQPEQLAEMVKIIKG